MEAIADNTVDGGHKLLDEFKPAKKKSIFEDKYLGQQRPIPLVKKPEEPPELPEAPPLEPTIPESQILHYTSEPAVEEVKEVEPAPVPATMDPAPDEVPAPPQAEIDPTPVETIADSPPKPKKHRRRSLRRVLIIVGLIVLVIGLVGGGAAWWYSHHHKKTQPAVAVYKGLVPEAVAKVVNFPVYYPEPKKLPDGYGLSLSSFNISLQKTVVYYVTYGGSKRLIFGVQAAPSDQDLAAFRTTYMQHSVIYQSTLGKAEIGTHNDQAIVSLPLPNGPWIIVTAPLDINYDNLKQVLDALTK